MSPLTAIVVNYEGERLLEPCLASLEGSVGRVAGSAEIVVVDNGSEDGSIQLVRSKFPKAKLLTLEENRGFGAAVNEALRRSSGDWVLLMNNDVTVEPDAVPELLVAARGAGPDVGAVAAQMRFADGSERINSAGLEIDRLGVAYDRLLGAPTAASEDRPVEVFGTSAGAALYRRAMLEDLDGFDESFFVFLEDADLAWRARMRGWRSLYAPAAVVHHVHSGTAVHGSSFKHRHVGRNRVRLLAKNADARLLRRYGLAIVAYELGYVLYAMLADRTVAPLAGRLRGLRDWRACRRLNAEQRRPVELAPVRGISGALRRRRAWVPRGPLRAGPGP